MATENIVWVSRHLPTPRQMLALRLLYSDHLLRVDTRAFDDVSSIIARYKALGGTQLVIVAPLMMVRALVKQGIKPLWAEMEKVACDDPAVEVRIKDRCYKFVCFHRINGVKLELEHPLLRAASLTPNLSLKGETTNV